MSGELGHLNRRSFVTGLSFACSVAMVRGALASVEHKSALEERVRAQLDLGVRDGSTVGAVMMVVHHGKVLPLFSPVRLPFGHQIIVGSVVSYSK